MPASPAVASAQRTVHPRRTRLRRGVPGSATAEGTRSSGDNEGKCERSEATAGFVTNNRFSVLCAKEPAPGIQEKRESTLPLSPSFRRERPCALPLQTDTPSSDQSSSSGMIKDKPPAPASSPIPCSKRPSITMFARHTPASSTPRESSQQPSALAAASIAPTKPQAQPSPFVLPAGAMSARSLEPSSTSIQTPPNFTTAAPYLSFLASGPAPNLPSPPVTPDPMEMPCLATLPIHSSHNFRYLNSFRSPGPQSFEFGSQIPTSFDVFRGDDPMRHIVQTSSGKIFCIAAEIAAANARSTVRPAGNVLVPEPAKDSGEVQRNVDGKKLDRGSGDCVDTPEKTEDESDEEEGEGEEWLGKEDGFWRQPLEEGNVAKTKIQTGKEES